MASKSEKSSRKLSLKKGQLASKACERGKFEEAALLYTEAIVLDTSNHVLYANRSAVYMKTNQFGLALDDGKKAAELQPKWSKAHFRQAVALQCLGKYPEAIAAFASAIAHDQKSQQLVAGLIDAALKSPLKENIEKIFTRLKQVNVAQNPFVVVSIIGQELLNEGHIQPAITCLENALKIGTVGLRMRGSVISALTSAYWKIGNLSRSVELMEQDLEICRSLVDLDGECRVLGNLGNAYLTMKKADEALSAHRSQHMVASKSKNKKSAASALSSLARVYVSMADYPNAIDSHNKAIGFQRQLGDLLGETHELGCLGAVYLLASDCDNAIRCHEDQLKLAKDLDSDIEIALAYSNLGGAYNQKGSFKEAAELYGQVLGIADTIEDTSLEGRACAGLGRAYRSMGNLAKALKYYERQQAVAVKLKDRVMEGRALSSLGIIYLEQGECLHALKLHKVHLAICQEFSDRAGQGQAYGNMGCAYSALTKYEQAIKYHQMELDISKEVGDPTSEACTHGNLAVAYQGLGNADEARRHYEQHLAISRTDGDAHNEGVALFNLGNFYSSGGNFRKAIAYYEKYMSLTQAADDKIGENKACHNLAFAHFSLGNLKEAVRLYERNIALARDVGDKNTLGRAYCNLGLIHKDAGDFHNALTCQKNFQSVSQEMGHVEGEYRALGNIGDIYVKTKRVRDAVGYYEKQLSMSERVKDKGLLCQAYGALGHAYKVLGKLDKAFACHSKELEIHRDTNNVLGLFKALGHIGTDCSSSGKHDEAFEYFSEQRVIADQAKDVHMQARALGNLGLAKSNSGEYREAMRYLNNQIELLERISPGSLELGRAQGNLAECLLTLGDHELAKGNYELFLAAAKEAAVPLEQDKAYRGLGNTYRALGNLQQALFCFENRLVFVHELTEGTAKSSAYGELGNLHRTMGNFEQAATCYTQQLKLAKDCEDLESESDAECGLGEVHCKMGDYETALCHHENDLRLGDKLNSSMRQSRAFGNLGLVYELMLNYKKASECQEQHLSTAAQASDRVAKVDAYSSLGRNHYCMANFAQSISYLKQGLTIAETLGRSEDEATIRYWLGVALCAKKDVPSALDELYKAAELYECLRDAGIASGRFQFPMHEQQALCYQVLQRVLIDLGRREEALVVAERARARDFIDFFLRKQGAQPPSKGDWVALESYDQIMEVVNKQNGCVICYSLVLGYVCIWLVVPQRGIVKFHELRLSEDIPELMVRTDSGLSGTSTTWSLLERLIGQIREDIGVEPAGGSSVSTMSSSLSGSDMDEPWERGSFDGTTTRTRRSSDNSVSSMPATLSYLKNGLLKKGLRKLNGVHVDSRKDWLMKPPVQVLYESLIAPVEEFLPKSPESDGSLSDLILVPQGDLYLVPFSLLKNHSNDHLHKRFSLITVPSFHSLLFADRSASSERPSTATRLVVGDPQLPLSLDNYRCTSSFEQETELVGTLFGTKPLVGSDASKAVVCRKAGDAECIHFATNTSWKHSALVLSPNKGHDGTQGDSGSSENFLPSPVDFLLTASEICQMKLNAKLVVLGCGLSEGRSKMTLDGLMGLVRSFLLAGTGCLLISLWPVPEPAYKLLLQGFYKRFLRGMRASRALSHALKLVESNKEFAHPSNWAGFILVGRDVKGPKKTVQLREALTLMIESTVRCREALKVVLHLVDKANQRLLDNNTSLMYTAEASVANKLGDAQGWRDVLQSAGFRLRKAAKSLPDAIFFPLKDDKGKLRQCGDILRALLGLSPTTLQAISKILFSPSLVKALLELFNSVLSSFAKGLNNVQVPLQLSLWRVTGCHELLASMGFDLLGVGSDEVMLRSGGINSRRVLQCAVVALNTLTGGLGTDKTEINEEFPLRRSGSDSSLKSSVSTISSFSYASAERTIEAKSYYGSSRRSYVSDVDTILDELEMCQESSVDPEVNENFPLNTESRALSLDKKPRVRFSPTTREAEPSESARKHSSHIGNGSAYEPAFLNNNTLLPPEVEGVNGSSLNTMENGVSPVSGSRGQTFINIPRRTNGHSNGVASWEPRVKSPVIDKTSYQYPSHFREYSDSVDSQASSLSATSGGDGFRKTPGSITSLQKQPQRVNGVSHTAHRDHLTTAHQDHHLTTAHQDHHLTSTIDSSPQMRRGKFRSRNPVSDYELDLSRDGELVPLRSRSVSLESGVDDVDSLECDDARRSGSRHHSNDVETFHAVIQNTQLRGSRGGNTRGSRSSLGKSQSRSEETLLSVGSSHARGGHEPRGIFSMDVDTETNDALSEGLRGLGVNGIKSDVSLVDGGTSYHTSKHIARPYGSKNDQRRKLNVDHLLNLKNLQASAC